MTNAHEVKTIVLFSRCELVHLYGRISRFLSKNYTIIHVAYSVKEEKILRNKYAITQIINFTKEIQKIYKEENIDTKLCNHIDELIIEQSNNRFNLNSAIQYDRSFQYLSYQECLILSQIYYKFWDALITSNKINYLIHEPVSLYFNQIAAIICKKHFAKYITQVQVYGENKINFMIASGDDGSCDEITVNIQDSLLSKNEYARVKKFLDEFRSNSLTFFDVYSINRNIFIGILLGSLKIALSTFRNQLLIWYKNLKQPIGHVDIFLLKNRKFISEMNKLLGSYLYLKYDDYNPDEKYFYYPIHLEPEAVVLYWGDGIYKNQVKLIENIAAQIPPNCYLYVKDHPHAGVYRDMEDYRKIKAIPNVKLLNLAIPGKNIIQKSIGVITINGTSGFEALLLNKQVYTFGNVFYNRCSRVNKIKNIRDLRQILYSNHLTIYEDDDDFYRFVLSYLQSTHPGFTNYFLNYAELVDIDEEKNAEIVAKGLMEYFEKCNTNT